MKSYDFGADKLKATEAPMFFIHGDADGVRLDHIAELFRLIGWRDSRRPTAALRIATGHLAQYNTRHADAARARHCSDGERLFGCEAAIAIKNLYNCVTIEDWPCFLARRWDLATREVLFVGVTGHR